VTSSKPSNAFTLRLTDESMIEGAATSLRLAMMMNSASSDPHFTDQVAVIAARDRGGRVFRRADVFDVVKAKDA
jgi:hypothetical protein